VVPDRCQPVLGLIGLNQHPALGPVVAELVDGDQEPHVAVDVGDVGAEVDVQVERQRGQEVGVGHRPRP
jgi:hypothetical protein